MFEYEKTQRAWMSAVETIKPLSGLPTTLRVEPRDAYWKCSALVAIERMSREMKKELTAMIADENRKRLERIRSTNKAN